MYVIVTIAPPKLIHAEGAEGEVRAVDTIHVYGSPDWDTRHKAMVEMGKMQARDWEEYPDETRVAMFVRKVLINPSERD